MVINPSRNYLYLKKITEYLVFGQQFFYILFPPNSVLDCTAIDNQDFVHIEFSLFDSLARDQTVHLELG